GAILIDSSAANEVLGMLSSPVFYKEEHQRIYSVIKELYDDLKPIDLLTVTNKLRQNSQLEFIGGASYLASLTSKIASAANIEYHARIVIEKYILRELIATCGTIIKNAYDDNEDVLTIVDRAETNLFSIFQEHLQRDSKELKEAMKSALEELQERHNNNESYMGVPAGLKDVDNITGGWQRSHLIILAARPGMGKTAFALTGARNAAIDFQKKVAFFSLEMPANQLVHRLMSIESKIESDKISKGQLSDLEWKHLTTSTSKLYTSNLILDDTPALSIFDLRAKCRRLKKKHDIDMVIIDYLQLMRGSSENDKKGGNREQEISTISRSLKALAKELDIPIIALSQLSRQVEQRGGSRKPILSDLRESGSIEQDADQVLFIYRPEYYGLTEFEDENSTPAKGLAEVMFAKNRHGQTGNVKVRFISKNAAFADADMFESGAVAASLAAATAGINPNAGFNDGYQMLGSKINEEETHPENGVSSHNYPF
ncbi:MAG: replicative DNA helicase, partial [Bacteroidales bacterium]|nr:replicative DNA helicase [Bacteroidales bacterium]